MAFLLVTFLPACALGVLGWRLFRQDVALEARLMFSAKGRLWTVPAAGGEAVAISADMDGSISQ
ncbi:MAG: hypothetical protein NTY02_00800, partial [Acidobacteria bacterium]|nr:hypothetical protein [Acidobacteriota bacterium]